MKFLDLKLYLIIYCWLMPLELVMKALIIPTVKNVLKIFFEKCKKRGEESMYSEESCTSKKEQLCKLTKNTLHKNLQKVEGQLSLCSRLQSPWEEQQLQMFVKLFISFHPKLTNKGLQFRGDHLESAQ